MAQTKAQLVDYGTAVASSVPTNGPYLSAANTVAISTNGSGRLFVDSSGRVGIGTSSPSVAVHVSGASYSAAQLRSSNTASGVDTVLVSETTGVLRTNTNHSLSLGTNSTTALTIDTSQRVGIGTTTPDTTLTVGGTNAAIRVQPSNVANAQIFLRHGSLANNSGLEADNTGALAFYANGSERSRIDSSGRLLVGTSTGGTSTGSGQFRLGGAGTDGGALFLTNYGSSVANNGTVDLTVGTSSIIIYVGFLIVHAADNGTNANRTQTTFSVFGSPQNSSFTATQISTASAGASSTFTVTSPSAGVIRVTNTRGGASHISMCFMGTGWFMT